MAMDPSMPPQAQGAPAPQAAPSDDSSGGGGASQIVVGIQEGMAKLNDLMSQSQAISPEEKQQFGQIMAAYEQFVHQVLGSSGDKQPPGPPQGPQAKGQVPMEAGGANVQPAM